MEKCKILTYKPQPISVIPHSHRKMIWCTKGRLQKDLYNKHLQIMAGIKLTMLLHFNIVDYCKLYDGNSNRQNDRPSPIA